MICHRKVPHYLYVINDKIKTLCLRLKFKFPWWWLVEPKDGNSIFLLHTTIISYLQPKHDAYFIPEAFLCNCFHIPWVLFSKIKCPLFTTPSTKKKKNVLLHNLISLHKDVILSDQHNFLSPRLLYKT
jgi:hypothetical protein